MLWLVRDASWARVRADRRREVSDMAWTAALALVPAASGWPTPRTTWSDAEAEAFASALRAAAPGLSSLSGAAWATTVGRSIARREQPAPTTYWATQGSALSALADWVGLGGFSVETRAAPAVPPG